MDHANGSDIGRIDRGQRDRAEERIGLWYTIEQDQRPAGGISAKPAQREPVCRRVGRTAVGAAKQGEPGNIAQRIFEPARRQTLDPCPINRRDVKGLRSGQIAQRSSRYDDRRRIVAFSNRCCIGQCGGKKQKGGHRAVGSIPQNQPDSQKGPQYCGPRIHRSRRNA
jgi:hypothetical protein